MRRLLALTVIVVLNLAVSPCWSEIPHLIHYQGMLTDDEGTPLNTPQNLTFRIYDASTGGNLEWSETQNNVPLSNGLFSVLLGSVNPVDLPFDVDYWLEIEVGIYGSLSPRVRIASVGYAYRAEWADTTDHTSHAQRSDTADYALTADTAAYALAGGEGDIDWVFQITDTADTTLMTGGEWGIARSGNVLLGINDSTHVNLGLACTTGASGQDYKYCTVGGGHDNVASQRAATVAGGRHNTASGYYATVGGGIGATASGNEATVGGGEGNTASGYASFIGGGDINTASGSHATVGGGGLNIASSLMATVGGGAYNAASGEYATVPGGRADSAAGDFSLAAGDSVRVSSDADYTFAFGRDFTTSTPNAVIFHNSINPIKVGIGTTSPVADLDIESANPNLRLRTTSGSPVITLDKALGSYWGYLEFREDGASKWQAGVSSDNNYYILNWPLSKYVFYSNSAGNVGIGTTNPTGQLDVNGNDIRIRSSQSPGPNSDGYTGEIAWDAGHIYICTSGDGPGGGTDTWKSVALTDSW